MTVEALFAQDFATLPELVAAQAQARPDHVALIQNGERMPYAELDGRIDRIAAALQRDGVAPREAVAICATTSLTYAALFLGVLRAGAAPAPLAPSSSPESLAAMVEDCGSRLFFLDAGVAEAMAPVIDRVAATRIALDDCDAGRPFGGWLAAEGVKPAAVETSPEDPFNIIYSSGTTGTPKGIVQPHSMRWTQLKSGLYDASSVTMISTPLYSNTTLVSFLPTLANGGTVVLMAKFDAAGFLKAAEAARATHAMLVPVQYRRIMERPDFDSHDLKSFRVKFSTSAPFTPEVKADVLKRWPGGLIEFYGMTEGGGGCALVAHEHPDKLHTVGRPMEGHDIRLIGEDGAEVAPGEVGEIVGRSGSMMVGYHKQAGKTRDAQWVSPQGLVYIRTGDVGRFDAEGFLTLMDRKKDMIISGGFNIYPSDIEAEIGLHPAVLESAVLGVESDRWGETPVAFVVLRAGEIVAADELKAWVNGRLGKTQRLHDLKIVDSLPRSHIGKVLKREMRDAYGKAA